MTQIVQVFHFSARRVVALNCIFTTVSEHRARGVEVTIDVYRRVCRFIDWGVFVSLEDTLACTGTVHTTYFIITSL